MSFAKYVDSLAKQGVIDGHISEMLMAKHRDECENPYGEVRKGISVILDDMWQYGAADYADRIDDALYEMEEARK